MNAVKFPNMLNSNKTVLVYDKEATRQNLETLILSTKLTLLGDPYFGTNLSRMFFEHNNVILQDIIIDDIFSAINTFMPQIRVLRDNINITSDGNKMVITIVAQNILDYSFDEYTINLLNVEEL